MVSPGLHFGSIFDSILELFGAFGGVREETCFSKTRGQFPDSIFLDFGLILAPFWEPLELIFRFVRRQKTHLLFDRVLVELLLHFGFILGSFFNDL